MAISADFVTPKVVRNVQISLDENEAQRLMCYLEENGSWDAHRAGKVAEKVYTALEDIGVREG